MKRSTIAATAALLVISSSVTYGLVRHMEYAAAITGKDGSPIHGSATMKSTADDKGTEIVVKLLGDAAATTRPWHVHMGSCTKAGAPWGGGKPYTPLTSDAKGAGESKAIIPMAVPDTGSYYVNIHESATNMGKIVACGDMKMKM